jgi:iron complex outermembrane receptor protein
MRISLLLSTCSAIAVMTLSHPALAEEDDGGKAASHEQTPANIIVTAPFQRDRSDILSGVSVLQGSDLTQAIRPSIGETLQHTPGVSATSFGPSASRPVLRGLQGERVRVLVDGIGSIDVSNTSVDHAPVVNPLLAERIEVLRGPQSLLFGASAIGGVVNVIDKRIPRSVPDEPVHVDAMATYGSAADERSGAGSVDVPLGDKFVVHADGSYLKSDNMRIGGYALSPSARAQALASSQLPAEEPEEGEEAIDFAGNAAIRGKLPNSQAKTWTAGVGAALIEDQRAIGTPFVG